MVVGFRLVTYYGEENSVIPVLNFITIEMASVCYIRASDLELICLENFELNGLLSWQVVTSLIDREVLV